MNINHSLKKVSDIKIAYIGGGSKQWARLFMNDMALDEQLCGEVNLYDIDFEAAKSNEIIGNSLADYSETKSKWKYKAFKNIKDALTGADFVFISILPGTFDDMYKDVHYPEKYGIYQSVGDTVGLGGIIRSWRTVHDMEEIALKIKENCPKAWVLNFTNPMSVCINTLYKIFPEIKAYGCCHEVFGTQKLLKYALEEFSDIKEVNYEDIRTNVIGLNHFTWITEATYKGIDLFPVYKKFVDKYFEEGYIKNQKKDQEQYFKSAEKVKFDLFKKHNLIAAAGDRHLAEFLPNSRYLKNYIEWKFLLTPVSFRKARQLEREEETKDMVTGTKRFNFTDSGEDFVRQIKALVGLQDLITNVNLPNVGQISNLPLGIVVETNAFFSTNSMRAVYAGNLPSSIQNTVMTHAINQDAIVKSAISKNKEDFFKAFINDPQASNLTYSEAKELFESMLSV